MSKKTFETPNKACQWALSYLHCSNAEVVVFSIGEDKIEEFFIGEKKVAQKIISKHRGLYAIVSTDDIEIHHEKGPFMYGLCLN